MISTITKMPGHNNIAKLFKNLNKIGYLSGLPNIWVKEVDFSDLTKKIFNIYRVMMIGIFVIFICAECAAFYTQKNLSEKQSGDLVMFGLSHPVLFLWIVVTEYQKNRIKILLYQLAVVLKEVHNDEEVEMRMVKKAQMSCAVFSGLFMMSLMLYGYDGIMQVARGEGTFTTVITFWPDVEDQSWFASVARAIIYLLWWAFMIRVCIVDVNTISTLICLSHQFKNLQSYFHSLNGIFQEENLDQAHKEEKYEAAFKVGIRMHSQTLWCTTECQKAYQVLFSCQIFAVVAVLVLLMSQMMNSEHTLENVLSIVATGICMLFSTGFIMWNAGDVTIEASEMSMAMYCSGWHNCQHSARRIRGLMIISMTQSQRPVIIWALGIVALSYESYVSIVKSSYSVFSVIY